jgi:CDP-diacylglycerol--glycerol-3-phosphate 3-phosphatidyltransferase
MFYCKFSLSSANLSCDYFTNRQDRYVLFRDAPRLANFFVDLVKAIGEFSFRLGRDNSLNPAPVTDWVDPSTALMSTFVEKAREKVEIVIDKYRAFETNPEVGDTWVWPLVQMGQLGIDRDRVATSRLLTGCLKAGSVYKMASGYFNLTDDYKSCILMNDKSTFDILMAHPKANGFFNASGAAGGIPPAYTLLTSQFLDQILATKAVERVRLFEYLKPPWTFHGKGLWMYPTSLATAQETFPFLTLVGSPNFGKTFCLLLLLRVFPALLSVIVIFGSMSDSPMDTNR